MNHNFWKPTRVVATMTIASLILPRAAAAARLLGSVGHLVNRLQVANGQRAEIDSDWMCVVTGSKSPAGNLEHFETTLDAQQKGDGMEGQLGVSMNVRVKVPKLFKDRADAEVQQTAVHAVQDQSQYIQNIIAEPVVKRLILPDLERDH